ncbi:hypothetical protein ACFQ0O_19230 [Saccharopolyspora spinosporotrichia]
MGRHHGRLDGLDTSTPAVVFKLDPNVMHHGGLGLIRSLGRAGVPMYAVQEHRYAPAAHSRYVRGHWVWRPDAQDVDGVLRGLRGIAERIGRTAVLFPTDDAGAIFLAEHGNSLREWFSFPQPPHDLPRLLAGKYTMYRLCQALGVPCAQATMVEVPTRRASSPTASGSRWWSSSRHRGATAPGGAARRSCTTGPSSPSCAGCPETSG